MVSNINLSAKWDRRRTVPQAKKRKPTVKQKKITRKDKMTASRKTVKPKELTAPYTKEAESIPDVFTSPESSNVEGGSYIADVQEAVIAFRDKKLDNAPTVFYHYDNVTPEDWRALKNADSKGKHMAAVFTRKYKGVRMEG